MGTRLWTEQIMKQRFPHIRYIRIHNSGSHKATIYAWNEQLQLAEHDARELGRYATDYLSPEVCFTVKSYESAAVDGVSPLEIPEQLKQEALKGSLDQRRVFAVLNDLLAGVVVAYRRYDIRTGTVHMAAYSCYELNDRDKGILQKYADELMPVGSVAAVMYYGS
ncbi:hypothetical protein [Paenibacillus sp. NPDC058071]|uniref:hypothetical protein n=1 Tax=Paenibacillus sp. NPDC058071 TaxID=3346326 RepID=UPI0036DAEFB7